jgi:hypothetical protein
MRVNRHQSSLIWGEGSQGKIAGDTEKTCSDCIAVPRLSRKRHPSCEGGETGLTSALLSAARGPFGGLGARPK